ncbi:hypothetical protein BpHYR1_052526 [Brachionus plicatilis]|uniref:Uncharacterized protein n=1 Tax=Brachionus plicatilis TaxID=10195 RepID=A0A3M7PJG1_BRAPC|nr:hypothetical protein BpHYR1_052526 [Brachionus plicatilis]
MAEVVRFGQLVLDGLDEAVLVRVARTGADYGLGLADALGQDADLIGRAAQCLIVVAVVQRRTQLFEHPHHMLVVDGLRLAAVLTVLPLGLKRALAFVQRTEVGTSVVHHTFALAFVDQDYEDDKAWIVHLENQFTLKAGSRTLKQKERDG